MKNRSQLRSAIFTAKPFRSKIVTDEATGTQYEVRQPSIRDRAAIRSQAFSTRDGETSFDPFEFILRAAIHCTYVPGTDEKVFDDADYDDIVAMPAGGIIDELSSAASALCNVESGDTKKPSNPTASDSSSL